MRRRDLVLGLWWTFASSAGFAQQRPKPKRIGVLLGIANDAEGKSRVSAFVETLRDFGWENGKNIQLDVRFAEADVTRVKVLAAELIALEPSVLVASSAPATSALREATKVIPIVFVQVNDPIGQGLIKSLAKPGANVTGFLNYEPGIAGKWLELLKKINPGLSSVGVIINQDTASRGSGGAIHIPLLQAAAPPMNIRIVPILSRNVADVERGITDIAGPSSGLIVLPDVFNSVNRSGIIASAAAHRIPAIYPYRFFVADGGLISYGIELTDLYRRAAGYVDRILRGEKPDELPVQAPTKFQFVINLKTAKALGIEIPATVLAQADEVIE